LDADLRRRIQTLERSLSLKVGPQGTRSSERVSDAELLIGKRRTCPADGGRVTRTESHIAEAYASAVAQASAHSRPPHRKRAHRVLVNHKNALWDHRMHATLSIDQLRDAEIRCVTSKQIGILATELVALHQKVDHLA
jgi:hypothetical protein